MFGPFFKTARGTLRLLSAGSHDLIGLPGLGPHRLRLTPWSAIIPLFLIFLLSGCGGLSVTSKNAIVATPATIAFGSVTVGQTATADVKLQNRGLDAVEIEDLSVSGSTFSIVGTTSLPMSLPAGGSVTLKLQFSPTASGSAAEPLMITSSLSADPASIAQVTGTGTPGASGGPKKVQLSWAAPESANDIIIGYNIWRSANGAGYLLLNSAIDQNTSYVDASVQSGSAYEYYVQSVDSGGAISGPSNTTAVSVP